MTAPWDQLQRELDAWGAAGRMAAFWWRDDDAVAATPALQRLVELGPAPLALAVIPAATAGFAVPAHVTVIQHGWDHQNRAGALAKKSEFPPGQDLAAAGARLGRGLARLAKLFGPAFRPALAPPWNRIDPALVPRLPALGFCALSAHGDGAAADLPQINTHLDPVNWRGDRGHVGDAAALAPVVARLAAQRQTRLAAPIGLLTHHLVQDEGVWRFAERFVTAITNHGAARWVAPFVTAADHAPGL